MRKILVLLGMVILVLSGCKKPQSSETWTALGVPMPTNAKHDAQSKDDELENASIEMQQYYISYNVKYFDGRLPIDTLVECSPLHIDDLGYQGETSKDNKGRYQITIAQELCEGERVYLPVLLHEMVHIDIGDRENDTGPFLHGPLFHDEMRRLAEAGAFDDLW